jgi:VanZ family protein
MWTSGGWRWIFFNNIFDFHHEEHEAHEEIKEYKIFYLRALRVLRGVFTGWFFMTTTIHILRYWLPVVVLCAAIFIQSSFPSPEALPTFPFSDKLMHAAAYGLLAALICRATNSHARWRCRWQRIFLTGVIAASLYGLSDEWHQSFVAARSSDAADFLADVAGSIVGSGLFLWGLRRRFDTPKPF